LVFEKLFGGNGGFSRRQRCHQLILEGYNMLPAVGGPWAAKCMEVLQRIGRELGDYKSAYWVPVNPQLLPHYYTVITNPIFLGQIEDKLKAGKYRYPSEFAADVRLLWSNVKTFNPKGDFYRSLGDKVGPCKTLVKGGGCCLLPCLCYC
jgi:hypothetical protein